MKGSHCCTWCGRSGFVDRGDLERHWKASATCGRNRNVSNAYQPGTHEMGERPVMPGEHTLQMVRERTTKRMGMPDTPPPDPRPFNFIRDPEPTTSPHTFSDLGDLARRVHKHSWRRPRGEAEFRTCGCGEPPPDFANGLPPEHDALFRP